jgi:rare lipoprotein A
MTSCYDKLQRSVLRRRRTSHDRMRRYYGRARGVLASSLIALVFVTWSHVPARAQQQQPDDEFHGQKGVASFYGNANQGKRTASGGRFDEHEMTAAHPWLPFGTKVLVTVQSTGRSVIVTITDRLPSRRRIIDLSKEAAAKLGIIRQGVAMVILTPG